MQSYNRAFGHNRHQCTVQELTEIQTWFRCNLLMRRSLQSALFLAAIGAIAPQISGREHSIVRIFDDWAKGGRSSTSPLKSHTWLVRGKYSMCACVEFSLENHDFMRNFVLRVVNCTKHTLNAVAKESVWHAMLRFVLAECWKS